MLDLWEHAELDGVWVLRDLVQAQHRAPDQAGFVEDLAPLVARATAQRGVDQVDEFGHVLIARARIGEPLVVDQVFYLERGHNRGQ